MTESGSVTRADVESCCRVLAMLGGNPELYLSDEFQCVRKSLVPLYQQHQVCNDVEGQLSLGMLCFCLVNTPQQQSCMYLPASCMFWYRLTIMAVLFFVHVCMSCE
jgi:hypothetical protein